MRIIALSWHPGKTDVIISGGYRRFYEIAKRCPYDLVVVDSSPTVYKSLDKTNVQIITYKPFRFPQIPVLGHFTVRITTVFKILQILFRIVRKDDILYVPDSELSHLTLPAILFKWVKGNRVVLSDLNVNTILPERILNVFLHKFSDRVITISQALKEDLKNSGIMVTDINGVGFDKNEFIPLVKNKKYDAVYIGRHIAQKGIWDLLDVVKRVTVQTPNFKIVAIGNTPIHLVFPIKNKISELKLEKNIKLMGDVSDSQKLTTIAESKIMIFPSHQEGWGIAPMEALSMGIPVIAYSLPVYMESIGKSESFRTVMVGNTVELAETVIDTLKNLDKYTKMAKNWKPVLDWESVARREWEIVCNN
jgi:glycosyltransferase involved in cell wall biosynthesis